MIFLDIFLWSFVLWLMFIVFANTRKYTGKEYNPLVQALAHLYGFVFGVADILLNITYGSIAFADLPQEFLLTTRLKRLLSEEPVYSKRYRLAAFVCRDMIEPWHFGHCSLSR